MNTNQDSIIHTLPATAEGVEETHEASPPSPYQATHVTPYQVLRKLPKDATPAQQDSAIQAVFRPKQITYSSRPDTLHLPGHDVGKNFLDADLPTYYRENFFSADTLLHPELNGGRFGVAGDPVPYSLRNDNVITLTILLCFILTLVAFRMSSRFLLRQVKNFFYVSHSGPTFVSETTSEVRFQFFLVLQGCLMLSIFQYQYTKTYISDTFILSSHYLLTAIFLAVLLGYFFCKWVLVSLVDKIFFEARDHLQWAKAQLFLTAIGGVLIAPAILLQIFFDMDIEKATVYLLSVFILIKILLFYKCYVIFFKRIGSFLQIILYFCALEIVPPFSIWGCLLLISNCLKVNY